MIKEGKLITDSGDDFSPATHQVTLEENLLAVQFHDGDGSSMIATENDGSPSIEFPNDQTYFCFHSRKQFKIFCKAINRLYREGRG